MVDNSKTMIFSIKIVVIVTIVFHGPT